MCSVPRSSRNAPLGSVRAPDRPGRAHPAAIMVNGGLRKMPVRIDKRQSRAAVAAVDLAIETRVPPGVARSALLLDPNPDRVLIAIHPHLEDALGVSGAFTFPP